MSLFLLQLQKSSDLTPDGQTFHMKNFWKQRVASVCLRHCCPSFFLRFTIAKVFLAAEKQVDHICYPFLLICQKRARGADRYDNRICLVIVAPI